MRRARRGVRCLRRRRLRLGWYDERGYRRRESLRGEGKQRTKKMKEKKGNETLDFNRTRLFIHSYDLFTPKVSPLAIFM